MIKKIIRRGVTQGFLKFSKHIQSFMKTKQKYSASEKMDGNCRVFANKLHNSVLSPIGSGGYFSDFS